MTTRTGRSLLRTSRNDPWKLNPRSRSFAFSNAGVPATNNCRPYAQPWRSLGSSGTRLRARNARASSSWLSRHSFPVHSNGPNVRFWKEWPESLGEWTLSSRVRPSCPGRVSSGPPHRSNLRSSFRRADVNISLFYLMHFISRLAGS